MNRKLLAIICLLLLTSLVSCNFGITPYKYSSIFARGGYYVCYDGIHYKYACYSSDTVRDIIKFYYPDCFDIAVYEPGTPETGYLNTYYYATWKSYMEEIEIQ